MSGVLAFMGDNGFKPMTLSVTAAFINHLDGEFMGYSDGTYTSITSAGGSLVSPNNTFNGGGIRAVGQDTLTNTWTITWHNAFPLFAMIPRKLFIDGVYLGLVNINATDRVSKTDTVLRLAAGNTYLVQLL